MYREFDRVSISQGYAAATAAMRLRTTENVPRSIGSPANAPQQNGGDENKQDKMQKVKREAREPPANGVAEDSHRERGKEAMFPVRWSHDAPRPSLRLTAGIFRVLHRFIGVPSVLLSCALLAFSFPRSERAGERKKGLKRDHNTPGLAWNWIHSLRPRARGEAFRVVHEPVAPVELHFH